MAPLVAFSISSNRQRPRSKTNFNRSYERSTAPLSSPLSLSLSLFYVRVSARRTLVPRGKRTNAGNWRTPAYQMWDFRSERRKLTFEFHLERVLPFWRFFFFIFPLLSLRHATKITTVTYNRKPRPPYSVTSFALSYCSSRRREVVSVRVASVNNTVRFRFYDEARYPSSLTTPL